METIIKRNYDWEDGKMLERALYFYEILKEEIQKFQKSFTIFDEKYLNNFYLCIKKAKEILFDNEISKEISNISEEIEKAMVAARKQVQKVFIYIKNAFISDKNILKSFGKSDFEKARNSKQLMIKLLGKAYNLAYSNDYREILLNSGLSIIDIQLLNQLGIMLDNMINSRDALKIKRQQTTKGRIMAHNEVWSFIVQISNASKVVFIDNPQKIKQFLLYPSLNNLPFKVQNIQYDKMLKSIIWDETQNSVTYELFYKPKDNSADWEKIYAGEDTGFKIMKKMGECMFRCRGINNFGFGYWSDIITIEH